MSAVLSAVALAKAEASPGSNIQSAKAEGHRELKWVQGLVPGVGPGSATLVLGGYIGSRLGWGTVTGFNLRSLFLAIGGALILLILYRLIRGRRR